MEAILRQELPPVAFIDLDDERPDCTDLLTRSYSEEEEEESALTVGDLKDTSRQTPDSKPDKCTTWTDEKHSLYLRHLESSFIEQLHRSMDLSRWRSEREPEGTTVSRKLSANEQYASKLLTVLHDGSRKKIEPHRSTLNSGVTGKKRVGWKRIYSMETEKSSDSKFPVGLCIQDESVECLEEFSDQNFAEDVIEKSSTFMSKRSKTSAANSSSHDQIVPVGKSYMTVSAPGPHHKKTGEKHIKNAYKILI